MKKILIAVVGAIDLRDLFAFGGLAMLCHGAAQVYPPAGWIIGGGFILVRGLRG